MIRLRREDKEGNDGKDSAVSAVQEGTPLFVSSPCSRARIDDKASMAAADRGGNTLPVKKEFYEDNMFNNRSSRPKESPSHI